MRTNGTASRCGPETHPGAVARPPSHDPAENPHEPVGGNLGTSAEDWPPGCRLPPANPLARAARLVRGLRRAACSLTLATARPLRPPSGNGRRCAPATGRAASRRGFHHRECGGMERDTLTAALAGHVAFRRKEGCGASCRQEKAEPGRCRCRSSYGPAGSGIGSTLIRSSPASEKFVMTTLPWGNLATMSRLPPIASM